MLKIRLKTLFCSIHSISCFVWDVTFSDKLVGMHLNYENRMSIWWQTYKSNNWKPWQNSKRTKLGNIKFFMTITWNCISLIFFTKKCRPLISIKYNGYANWYVCWPYFNHILQFKPLSVDFKWAFTCAC